LFWDIAAGSGMMADSFNFLKHRDKTWYILAEENPRGEACSLRSSIRWSSIFAQRDEVAKRNLSALFCYHFLSGSCKLSDC
jgi:hypothetical protein